jgi:hypothetical protein
MESLIYRTLHKEHRFATCPARKCNREHQEWFETTVEEARKVVEAWQEFSKLKPYKDSGELNESWQNLAPRYQNKMDELYVAKMEWLTVWKQGLTTMGERRIKKKEKALRDRLKDAEESKKWAEKQLRKAEQKEDFIRRRLSGLKIGDK